MTSRPGLRKTPLVLLCLVFPFLVAVRTPELPQNPAEPGRDHVFSAGERLTYAISWQGIRGGTAVMEVAESEPIHGRPAVRLLTVARSNSFISTFFLVDNRVESILDLGRLAPHRMIFHRREGRKKNDFDVTFHHEQGSVTAIKDGVADNLSVPPSTQDALSCLYYLRSLPSLEAGSSVLMNVFHDKKLYRLEVKVEGIERVHGPWGEADAVKVLAMMPFKGIFPNEGNIKVWFRNDASRVPLMMKAKVRIGSIVARLMENSDQPPPAS
jgi:hypothetical protein